MTSQGIGYYGICFGSICSHNRRFSFITWCPFQFFQPLIPRTSTRPNKICIVYSHTLARSPREILAWLYHRGPSNWPQCRPSHFKNGENSFDYKLTQNISHNIQTPMKPYQAVLYIKKKVRHRSITTSKYIKFRQPRPEIGGVSKITLTVRHPVLLL